MRLSGKLATLNQRKSERLCNMKETATLSEGTDGSMAIASKVHVSYEFERCTMTSNFQAIQHMRQFWKRGL